MLSTSFLYTFPTADMQGSVGWGLVDITVLSQKTQTVIARISHIKWKYEKELNNAAIEKREVHKLTPKYSAKLVVFY